MNRPDWMVCDTIYNINDCSKILKCCLDNIDRDVNDLPAERATKTSEVKISNYRYVRDLLKEAHEFVLYANKNFYGFDLFDVSGGDNVSINVYDSKNFASYEWHVDGPTNAEVFDSKLTMLINLSQETYIGGQLQIFTNGGEETVEAFSKTGAVCIFPSWIPHRVTKVISGKRISFTQFYTGPRLR